MGFRGQNSRIDRMYKRRRPILDRGRWRRGPAQRILAFAMTDTRGPGGGRPSGRPRADDPMMREVRWRLFRREDMPARLRRLQRMEDAAFRPPPVEDPPPDGEAQTGR